MLPCLHIVLVTPTVPGMAMPYAPSVGNELAATRASAYPPDSTLERLCPQHRYAGRHDRSPQRQGVTWILMAHLTIATLTPFNANM